VNDWLSIDLVLVALLVTSFTCTGLVALWAANSSWHWFIRIAVLALLLAPLLLISAYEPLVAFTLQSGIIFVGVALYRKPAVPRRFALSTFLLVVVVLAATVAIGSRLPRLNVYAWSSVALNGAAAGFATLIGVWWTVSRSKRFAVPSGIFGCIALGFAISMLDWFFPSIANFTDWPPDPSAAAGFIPGFGNVDRPILAALLVPLLISSATFVVAILWRAATRSADGDHHCIESTNKNVARAQKRGLFAPLLLAASVIALSLFPSFILFKLLNPDDLPNTTLPSPNGYDDIAAAAKLVTATGFGDSSNFDYQTASQSALAAEVAKSQPAYERLESGLSRPDRVPVDYSSNGGDLPMEPLLLLRNLARSLAGRARLAELENRHSDATDSYLLCIELGYDAHRGGLLVDGMVGVACSDTGTLGLYQTKDNLPPEKLAQSINTMIQLDASEESYDDMMYRDRVWTQRTNGWHSHLQQLLTDIADHDFGFSLFVGTDNYRHMFTMRQAEVRLLICELAIAQFRREEGRLPNSLAELGAKYLPAVPIDPWHARGRPLRYQRTDDSYVLYSVGQNGVDDHGAPPDDDDFLGMPTTGDLRLDRHYALEEDADTEPSSEVPGAADNR
jgi:hypothetical protein